MTHREYEHHVARILAGEGWTTTVTPGVRDFGIDIVAERAGCRLGVQAKMYGGGRRVSGRIVQELFGAAALADCDRSMIATDGRVLPDAQRIADKLGVEIRHVETTQRRPDTGDSDGRLSFDEIWTTHVAALVGRTLVRADGKSNQVVSVDGSALHRITSNGRRQSIEIEIFRWAVERLLAGEIVTQAAIKQNSRARASSGIAGILGELPMFGRTMHEGKRALRLVEPGRSSALT